MGFDAVHFGRAKIKWQNLIPVLFGYLVDGLRTSDARVVDQDRHGAQFASNRLYTTRRSAFRYGSMVSSCSAPLRRETLGLRYRLRSCRYLLYLPDGLRATRKPRKSIRDPGTYQKRHADRQPSAQKPQHPPRCTRNAPLSGPGGSLGGELA